MRLSNLIETFKIFNRKYDINPELFFQLDEGDRRGHDHKLFKKRFNHLRRHAGVGEFGEKVCVSVCLSVCLSD